MNGSNLNFIKDLKKDKNWGFKFLIFGKETLWPPTMGCGAITVELSSLPNLTYNKDKNNVFSFKNSFVVKMLKSGKPQNQQIHVVYLSILLYKVVRIFVCSLTFWTTEPFYFSILVKLYLGPIIFVGYFSVHPYPNKYREPRY